LVQTLQGLKPLSLLNRYGTSKLVLCYEPFFLFHKLLSYFYE